MRNPQRKIWYVWLSAALLISALALSPLVSPAGEIDPVLLGMPRTLWAGILATAALVFLTYLTARDAPRESNKDSGREA